MRYRFRAGDAPNSPWYTIATRPPPAFTGLSVVITPPSYMKRAPQTVNAREGRLVIPAGSQVRVNAASNTPLESITLRGEGFDAVSFTTTGQPTAWTGATTIAAGKTLR